MKGTNMTHYIVKHPVVNFISYVKDPVNEVIEALCVMAKRYKDYTIMVKVGKEEMDAIKEEAKSIVPKNVSFFQSNETYGRMNLNLLRNSKTLTIILQ